MTMTITVNGQQREVDAAPTTMLLYVLRNDLQLNGPKFGCGLEQCGACTVLLNGQPARSCSTTLAEVGDQAVTTLEGLGTGGAPHALQQAFLAEQAGQCGYCIPGMIVSAAALLQKSPVPTDDQIKQALDGNLCRCGSHFRIMRAVKRASGVSA
ncbi:MAG: (2Fe-2S)-binding protein [Chloroflexota bacterium]